MCAFVHDVSGRSAQRWLRPTCQALMERTSGLRYVVVGHAPMGVREGVSMGRTQELRYGAHVRAQA